MVNRRTIRIPRATLRPSSAGWQRRILPGLVVILLVALARALGLLQHLEWRMLDSFLRWRPAEPPDQRLLIVGIDETDIQRTGAYPIPDQDLAKLLQILSQSQPRAIGIDFYRDLPVRPGHDDLVATFQNPAVFGIEKMIGNPIPPPPGLPPHRVGFVDLPLDKDGFVRRAYLGRLPPPRHPRHHFRFSFAFKLAEAYLAEEGLTLERGRLHPHNMRFGDTELAKFRSSSGGYVATDAGGVQMLINPRSGRAPFERVSMTDVLDGRVDEQLIRDRIILIGIVSLGVKDLVNSAAVQADNPGLLPGVEMQAHVISQILSAVLDNRPPLRTWPDGWEYLWIGLWGLIGMLLVRYTSRPVWYMLAVGTVGLILFDFSLLMLWLGGWWIPVVPTLMVFTINGLVLPGFYLYDQTLRSRIDERQRVIERTYDAIHNGPLQILALLLQEQETLALPTRTKLELLNQELRAIYNHLLQESLPLEDQLQLGSQCVIDLRDPLHEVLYRIYNVTLERNFPGFNSIAFQMITFDPLPGTDALTADDKRAICRFLEEALCNVGKHAIGATRLTVLCITAGTENIIRVADNGREHIDQPEQAEISHDIGRGTQQALALAQRLQGTFQRSSGGQGTVCELRWPQQLSRSWWD